MSIKNKAIVDEPTVTIEQWLKVGLRGKEKEVALKITNLEGNSNIKVFNLPEAIKRGFTWLSDISSGIDWIQVYNREKEKLTTQK